MHQFQCWKEIHHFFILIIFHAGTRKIVIEPQFEPEERRQEVKDLSIIWLTELDIVNHKMHHLHFYNCWCTISSHFYLGLFLRKPNHIFGIHLQWIITQLGLCNSLLYAKGVNVTFLYKNNIVSRGKKRTSSRACCI